MLVPVPSVDVTGAVLKRNAWLHASPSQVKTYTRCNRRWWLDKIAGVPTPSKPWLEQGREIHKELEDYLTTAKAPGRIASAGLEYLPIPPVDRRLVERAFGIVLHGFAVPVVGLIVLI